MPCYHYCCSFLSYVLLTWWLWQCACHSRHWMPQFVAFSQRLMSISKFYIFISQNSVEKISYNNNISDQSFMSEFISLMNPIVSLICHIWTAVINDRSLTSCGQIEFRLQKFEIACKHFEIIFILLCRSTRMHWHF